MAEVPEWETPDGVKNVADVMRGTNGLKVRQGVELGKRIEYFKGQKLIDWLIESDNPKKPDIDDEKDAIKFARLLLRHNYIHRSEKSEDNKKLLRPTKAQDWDNKGYYTWMYEGSKTFSHFMTGALIVTFLACTCFPIWPKWMKVAIWYCSVTLLIIFFIISVIRLIIFLIFWIFGVEFWILPRLYDESITFAQSFVPLYTYEKLEEGQELYRLGLLAMTGFFVYWVASQPSEFDEFILASRKFTDDLYSGNLLPDRAQSEKDDIDKVVIPDLDDLMKEQDDNGNPVDSEDVVDKFMDEKFFGEDDEDEDDEDARMDKEAEEKEAAEAAAKDKEL
jgi:translocation protein SEC62